LASSITTIQNSLSAGELSPALLGRTDLGKYTSGASTCRNFIANYTGGVMSRAGLAYIGTCKQSGDGPPPRDIPFQFSLNQGYVLEFGDHYLRVKFDGAYVLNPSQDVVDVDQNGIVVTASPNSYQVGDWVYSTNPNLAGLAWIIYAVYDSTHFQVIDLFGDSALFPLTEVGGKVSKVYTQTSPYAVEDLPYLKYTQSADVMTLTCVNTETGVEYPPYSLVRLANDNWVFTQETFTANISAPTGVEAVAQSAAIVSTWYSYVVTAVDGTTGEESVASLPANVQNNDIAVIQGSNTLTWNTVPGASSYNVYKATPSYAVNVPVSSLYGFIGTALGSSFTDTNIVADFTVVPPKHNDPFASGVINYVTPTAGGSNYSQQTVGYSITTSTGSGFSGTPVVDNSGSITGFVIYNKGHDYRNTDTITFTDSGGGRATGTVLFNSNPVDGNQLALNGINIAFTDTPHYPSDVGETFIYSRVEKTIALTIQTLANTLNASYILSLTVAEYTAGSNTLSITYKTPGVTGNLYSMSALSSPVTPSGAFLTGGGTIGTGATATLSVGELTGLYPSVAGYFQQRRVYAGSLNQPDTYWMSQPGLYNNMDSSIPVTDSDSITGTPWAQQVNGIQWLVPMPGGLVVLTGKGAWQINGGQEAAITPSNQTAVPQGYNGANNFVPPITINDDILFIQSKGSIARRLAYSFYTNIYTSTDLTILSDHLFTDFTIKQWCWCEEPYKLVWALRSDGILLCLTFLKEQEVYSWTRHDTNGVFVSVCSITEPPVDALYVITRRFVKGAWRYYSERMDDRIWENVEDSFCVDSGLTTSLSYPQAVLQPSANKGENVSFTSSFPAFFPGYEGLVIRVGGGKGVITSIVSSTEVLVDITETITEVVPDDPSEMPLPAESLQWSLSRPFTEVSRLNHLEGKEVAILADGSVVENQIVTNNKITLPQEASLVTVGLPYLAQVQTMYLNQPSQNGTIQNRRKNISSVGIRVRASRGLEVGADQPDQSAQQNFKTIPWSGMSEIKERTNQVYAGSAIPLYTGDYYKNITSGWDLKGQVAIQQRYPLPANILSVVSYWTEGDQG